jgi:hypothetical protein
MFGNVACLLIFTKSILCIYWAISISYVLYFYSNVVITNAVEILQTSYCLSSTDGNVFNALYILCFFKTWMEQSIIWAISAFHAILIFLTATMFRLKLQRHLWLNSLQIKHFLLWNGFYVLFSCLNVIVTMYEGFRGTFEFFPFDLIMADN